MKEDQLKTLIKYRIEQSKETLHEAEKFIKEIESYLNSQGY